MGVEGGRNLVDHLRPGATVDDINPKNYPIIRNVAEFPRVQGSLR